MSNGELIEAAANSISRARANPNSGLAFSSLAKCSCICSQLFFAAFTSFRHHFHQLPSLFLILYKTLIALIQNIAWITSVSSAEW